MTDPLEMADHIEGNGKVPVLYGVEQRTEIAQALRTLQAENERLRELLGKCHLELWRNDAGSTHWKGCDADHPVCRLMREIDEVLDNG